MLLKEFFELFHPDLSEVFHRRYIDLVRRQQVFKLIDSGQHSVELRVDQHVHLMKVVLGFLVSGPRGEVGSQRRDDGNDHRDNDDVDR